MSASQSQPQGRIEQRQQAVWGRWVSLVCCGVSAAAIWAIIGLPVQAAFGTVVNHLASIRPDVLAAAILVVAIAGCWPLGHRRWRAFFGLRHFGTYPPLWVAAAIAMVIVSLLTGLTSGWHPIIDSAQAAGWFIVQSLWLWVGIGVTVIAFCVIKKLINEDTSKTSAPTSEAQQDNIASLVDWISNDHEILDRLGDRFGHDAVAHRIADRLTISGSESPTMAVVGPLGSGKSTIRGLVAERLKDNPSVELLHLSLWPFDSAEAAVTGILRAAVRSVGKHVNILAVSGLPERYVTTIERVAGSWGMLARYLRGESQPDAILEGLDAIAMAAGVKLVLWIEDMERFTGADRLSPEEAALREADRLGPILSLLYLLDRCSSVTVIISDVSLRSRLDIGKIARFVENPPRLTPQTVWRQITILRSACLVEDFIDPASAEYRKTLTPPEESAQHTMWFWSLHDTEPRIQEAIALLLDTPRAFKSALRITWETWDKLRGEIDFDSVLVASALRVARPDVFALIDEHIARFRTGFQDKQNQRGGQTPHPVQVQLDKLLAKENSERSRNAVKTVISFVFPLAFRTFEGSNSEYVECPQGLGVARHVDYWQRYLTLPFVDTNESDQAALRAIAAWKDSQPSDLISRLLDPTRADQIETFVGQFTPADLCRLLSEVAAALRDHSAADWERRSHAPGITAVWRMMHQRNPRSSLLGTTLKALVRDLTPIHLPLIHDIHYFFASTSGNVPRLIDDRTRAEVDAELINVFRASFPPGTGEQLLAAVRDGSPYVVYWICWGLQRIRTEQTLGLPFDEWASVREVLLEAAERDPQRGVPLILPFITSSDRVFDDRLPDDSGVPKSSHSFAAEFKEEAAGSLFDFDRLIRLLAKTDRPPQMDGQLAIQFDAAREAAIALLAGPPGTPATTADLPEPLPSDESEPSPEQVPEDLPYSDHDCAT